MFFGWSGQPTSHSPVTVSRFPHSEGLVELRKAFEGEVLGIHVKPHDVELRAGN
jgi:hypothetical protein